jgi:hypothetical protein
MVGPSEFLIALITGVIFSSSMGYQVFFQVRRFVENFGANLAHEFHLVLAVHLLMQFHVVSMREHFVTDITRVVFLSRVREKVDS